MGVARLVEARRLSAWAYGPVRAAGSLDALTAQAPLLDAADALERRVTEIQEWPFDEAILRAIAAIVSSVAAIVVAGVILKRLGL